MMIIYKAVLEIWHGKIAAQLPTRKFESRFKQNHYTGPIIPSFPYLVQVHETQDEARQPDHNDCIQPCFIDPDWIIAPVVCLNGIVLSHDISGFPISHFNYCVMSILYERLRHNGVVPS
jgi:hypothetical protein